MIQSIGKITLFVKDQEQAKKFWVEKVGFVIAYEYKLGDTSWLEVAPDKLSDTTFVLYEKQRMQKEDPTANVGHPSVILTTKDIDKAYEGLKSKKVSVGILMKLPYGKMFSFEDQDGNEYLLREI